MQVRYITNTRHCRAAASCCGSPPPWSCQTEVAPIADIRSRLVRGG